MRVTLVVCEPDEVFQDFGFAAFSIHEARPPLGLGSLAASLVVDGHEVTIVDQGLERRGEAALVAVITERQPDVVGFSSTSLNVAKTLRCAQSIRKALGPVYLVAGGIHATFCADELMDVGLFDAVIQGEAEDVLCLLVRNWEKGKELDVMLPGVWLNDRGQPPPPIPLKSLTHPPPDRIALQIDSYSNRGALVDPTPCHSLFQSRGCPHLCRFCAKPDYHKLYRVRPLELVLREILYLQQEHNAAALCFREDNFTASPNRLTALCDALQRHVNDVPQWECESRADLACDVLKIMREANCRGMWCGVETVVPRWQRWLNKELDRSAVRAFYDACAELGISTGALFLFGFPDQTPEELQEDINFALSLPVKWRYFQCLALFPGTRLTEEYVPRKNRHAVTSHVQVVLPNEATVEDMLALERMINSDVRVPKASALGGNCSVNC